MNHLKTALLPTTLALATVLSLASCMTDTKTGDAAAVAAEQNDAKFNNKKLENDAHFLAEAVAFNMEEIRLGELAQEKSSNADVIALGKMLVKAHTTSLKDVTALAKEKLVSIPTELTNDAEEAVTQLNAGSGNDFDKAYCNKMVDTHKNAIAMFEKEIADSRDGEIKEWAAATLIELRKHLDEIFICQKKCEEV